MAKFTEAEDQLHGKMMTVGELDKLSIDDPILDHLACPNCGCPLTFHHTGIRSAYLSTKKGCQHSKDCQKKVQIEERLTKYINSTHNNIYLTKPVRRKKAKDFYNRFQRGLKGNHESRKDISKQKSHRNGPRTRSKKRISNHATLNSKQGTIYDGERVTVRSANPENIGQHVGRVVVLYGYIIKGYVANDYAILTVSYHHQEAKVILNEGFFANAPIGYINELNEFINEYTSKNVQKPLFDAVANVELTQEGRIECYVHSEDSLLLDGLSLGQFLYHNSL